MTFTEIPKGTQNWDVSVNSAFTDLQNQVNNNLVNLTNADSALDARVDALENPAQPFSEFGFVGWNYDPVMGSGTTPPGTNQQLYMLRVNIPVDSLVSRICLGIGTAGATFVAGQNFIGLYNAAGTLLASSADQSTNWTNVGLVKSDMASPINVTAGNYFVGFIMNATTRPALLRTSFLTNMADVLSPNQSAENSRYAIDGTGLSALPASVNMTTRTKLNAGWWVGVE